VTVRNALDEAAKVLRQGQPAVEITTEVVHAEPRRVLVQASGDAVLTVVGNHGSGRLAEVLLGSVALHVASHGRSPVAVIPPHADPAGPAAAGPVLVGVDESGTASAAIGYAFDEAAVRGAGLDAVLVRDDSAAFGFVAAGTPITDFDDGQEHAVLAEQLAGYCDKYPDVAVRQIVVRGHPADGLIRYAESLSAAPQMVVLGSRGRGGVTGLLMGSTGQTLITRAAWPVLIVRDALPS
jgi:nucleotide-binding universal stress UspA family protein